MIETVKYEAFQLQHLSGEWLIELFKDDCVPCKMLGKSLERVRDRARILKVQLAESDFVRAGSSLSVRSVPTVLLVRDGKLLHQSAGFKSPADLARLLEEHFTAEQTVAEQVVAS